MPKSDQQNTDQKTLETPDQLLAKIAREQRTLQTTESTAYLGGLYQEFAAQVARYHDLTAHLRELDARVELAEKTLSLIRDHLAVTIKKTEFAAPHDWTKTLRGVRFAGVRPVDACVELLRERKKMTGPEMVAALNEGMFRFRTTSPLREIHAALMRQRHVKKTEDGWQWVEFEKAQQQGLRLIAPKEAKE